MIPIFGNQHFMETAKAIIDKLGGVNVVSGLTGLPQQTVSAWVCRKPPEIPPWRRSLVAAHLDKAREPITAAERKYLASEERTPRQKTAQC